MSIDPNSLPEGAVVEISRAAFVIREGGYVSGSFEGGLPFLPTRTVARAFVPVPDGMAYADAVAALADAGAWVEVAGWDVVPDGARLRNEWLRGRTGDRTYIHRDDLPPADPDAELVERCVTAVQDRLQDEGYLEHEDMARTILAVVREHEAAR